MDSEKKPRKPWWIFMFLAAGIIAVSGAISNAIDGINAIPNYLTGWYNTSTITVVNASYNNSTVNFFADIQINGSRVCTADNGVCPTGSSNSTQNISLYNQTSNWPVKFNGSNNSILEPFSVVCDYASGYAVATISNNSVCAQFATQGFVTGQGYITDGNTGWDNTYGYMINGGYVWSIANGSVTSTVSNATTVTLQAGNNIAINQSGVALTIASTDTFNTTSEIVNAVEGRGINITGNAGTVTNGVYTTTALGGDLRGNLPNPQVENESLLLDYDNITSVHKPTDLANFTNTPGYITTSTANVTSNGTSQTYALFTSGGNIQNGTLQENNTQVFTYKGLVVNSGANSQQAPATIGIVNLTGGKYAMIQFGDQGNAIFNANGARPVYTSYWGMDFRGNRQNTTVTGTPIYPAGGNFDPAVRIFSSERNSMATVLRIIASNTTNMFGNMTEWTNNDQSINLAYINGSGSAFFPSVFQNSYQVIDNGTNSHAQCGGTDQVTNVSWWNGTLRVTCSAQGAGGSGNVTIQNSTADNIYSLVMTSGAGATNATPANYNPITSLFDLSNTTRTITSMLLVNNNLNVTGETRLVSNTTITSNLNVTGNTGVNSLILKNTSEIYITNKEELSLYSENQTGIPVLKIKTNWSLDEYELMPTFVDKNIGVCSAQSASAAACNGLTYTQAGAGNWSTAYNAASGGIVLLGITQQNVAVGSGVGIKEAINSFDRGSSSFQMDQRVCYPDASYTNFNTFIGMTSTANANATATTTPVSQTAIGWKYDTNASDSFWELRTQNGTAISDYPSNVPFVQQRCYIASIYLSRNGTVVYGTIKDLWTGQEYGANVTTNLPSTGTQMGSVVAIRTHTVAHQQQIGFQKLMTRRTQW